MIRIFHNKKIVKWVWIALIIMIGPAFILWGINSYQRSEQEDNFGRIFGKRVARQEYVDALKASQLQMRMQFGEAYDELQKMMDFRSVAIQRLVLLADARRKHIRVSNQEVIDHIVKDPSFQRNGRFDKGLYETAIKFALHMTPRAFEEQMRQNLTIAKLSDVACGAIKVDEAEIREAYRKDNEKLNLDYAAAIPADFTAGINVTDDELKEYFSKNAVNFKQPLSFNLEYVMTDKEHQVTAINARLEKEPLEKIAADMGLEMKQTGLFGQADPIPAIGWSQELSLQLASAKPGQVFAPLEMEKKYYILRLKERKEPYVPELEPVKEKVKAAVIKERSTRLAREKMDAGLVKLSEAATAQTFDLTKSAATLGLKTGNTGLFKFGSYLESIGASDAFYTAGSSLAEGKLSGVIEMPSGYYVLRLKAKEAVDEKKFEQDKESVKQKLILQKKQQLFGKYVEELLKKALQ